MEYLLFYAAICLFVGWMGSGTTLGFGSTFLLSVILTPIVGFIIMLLYPAKKKSVPQNQVYIKQDKPSHDELAAKLEKLEEMRTKKLITESEYTLMRKAAMSDHL